MTDEAKVEGWDARAQAEDILARYMKGDDSFIFDTEDLAEELERAYAAGRSVSGAQRVAVTLHRSLERLSLAIEGCSKIGFQESSPTTNAHHASIWNDLNEAQKDAKLKLDILRRPSGADNSSQVSATRESASDRVEELNAQVAAPVAGLSEHTSELSGAAKALLTELDELERTGGVCIPSLGAVDRLRNALLRSEAGKESK